MQYEIEIKSLLRNQAELDTLLKRAKQQYRDFAKISTQTQLNHYFTAGTLASLIAIFKDLLDRNQCTQLQEIADRATSVNVRSRQKNDTVLLIVKGSLDNASAVHSHQRMEFEAVLPLTIEQLDALILQSDWQVEAKWQAERVLYTANGITIDTLFTPGYGYLVEFEKVINDPNERTTAHNAVLTMMKQLGVKELPNDRLERMFSYYNTHWQEYYGTRNTFIVE